MSSASSRHRTQGVARYGLLIVAAFIALGGAALYWKIKSRDAAETPAPDVVVATGPVVRDSAGAAELLQRARQAMAEQRLLAPAGNNALEFYLAMLKREPGNRVAQEALREIFPFAAHAAEQTIETGDDAEAQRQIDLLSRADPKNYTVTLLQAKLQERRTAAAQQAAKHEPQVAAPANRAAASVPAAPVVTAATPVPSAAPVTKAAPALTPAEQAIAQLHVESTPVEAAPRAALRARTAAATTADAGGAATPVLTRRVEPAYPADARRTRRQGWVDVTFTVQPDGSVSGASVAEADPKYVFDRAALNAVSRWQFSPGLQDGKPVAAQVRQRIEFHL